MGPLSLRGLLASGLLALGCTSLLGYDPALMAWRRQASDLRELDFKRDVAFERVTRAEIPGIVLGLMSSTGTAQYRRAYEDAYIALGVLPDGGELPKAIADFQESGVMGLYDPAHETMYVVTDVNQPEERNATVVHELIHALQHQSFPDFFDLRLGLLHNDDVVSALSAVLEGDAEFSMFGSLSYLRRTVSSAEKMRDLRLYELEHPGVAEASSPLWIRASHYFPYAYGTPVAARFYSAGGNEGLNGLMRNPPLSTLQLIHPESPPDVTFVELPLAALEESLESRGCVATHHNVAGALTVKVLFEEHLKALAPAALEGFLAEWEGDRFAHVVCGEEWELVWLSRWRTPRAAQEFADGIGVIAESLGGHSRLNEDPRAVRRDRDVLVLTGGLEAQRPQILSGAEFRNFSSVDEWLAADCFGEPACPEQHNPEVAE